MTAAVASVPTLGLPYAVGLLGWPAGLIALVCGGLVTMFTSFLIAGLLEFGGTRHLRFRDLAVAVFGGSPRCMCTACWMQPCSSCLCWAPSLHMHGLLDAAAHTDCCSLHTLPCKHKRHHPTRSSMTLSFVLAR
jgi:hypothetical protein